MHVQRAVWDSARSTAGAKEAAIQAAIQAVAEIEGRRRPQRAPESPQAHLSMAGEAIEDGEVPAGAKAPREFYNDKFWRIARRLALACDDEIAENPYCIAYRALPTVEIDTAWFDRLIVHECGMAKDDPRRVEFLIWSMVDAARRNGDTIVPSRGVLEQLAAAAEVPFHVAGQMAGKLVERDLLRSYRDDGRSFVAVRSIDDAERETARFLAERIERGALEFPQDSAGAQRKKDEV